MAKKKATANSSNTSPPKVSPKLAKKSKPKVASGNQMAVKTSSASSTSVQTRKEVTDLILAAKRTNRVTFEAIADEIERNKVWTVAAIFGHHPFSQPEAEAVLRKVGIDVQRHLVDMMTEIPTRGEAYAHLNNIADPTIYRLNETMRCYAPAVKAVINEMFGDGVMSAIDLEVNVEKRSEFDGERVVVTLDGKFLPFRKP